MHYIFDLQGAYAQSLRANTDHGMIAEAQKNGYGEIAERPYDRRELRFIDDVVEATIAKRRARPHDEKWRTCAGGPGVKKSTNFLRRNCAHYKIETTASMWDEASLNKVRKALRDQQDEAWWLSADRGALLDIMDALGIDQVTPEAYTRWRPAANYLLQVQGEAALGNGFTILHDTTLSSAQAVSNLATVGQMGRSVEIETYAAPMDQRDPAIERRIAGGFWQSWRTNIKDQDDKFAKNLPLFPSIASLVDFFWTDGLDRGPQEIAHWDSNGLVIVEGMDWAWANFKNMYRESAQVFEPQGSVNHIKDLKP